MSCLVHLADLAEFAEFNAAYERQFTGCKPVRTTVGADLVADMRVEVTVIARKAPAPVGPGRQLGCGDRERGTGRRR